MHRSLSFTVALGIALALLSRVVEGVRERKLYDILSVAPDATEQEIKKAYRKGALCASLLVFTMVYLLAQTDLTSFKTIR
jgi:hypothetical protein